MIQERLDVLFKTADDDGIGKKVLAAGSATVFEVLANAALFAIGTVADKGDDEAQATVMSGLEDIVKLPERLRIKLARLRLDAEIATDAVAHRLRADDAGAHHSGRVKSIVNFKMAWIAGTHGIDGAVGFQAEPFNVGTAVAESFAAQCQAGSVALHKFVVVLGLRRTPETQCDYGHSRQGHRGECAPQ